MKWLLVNLLNWLLLTWMTPAELARMNWLLLSYSWTKAGKSLVSQLSRELVSTTNCEEHLQQYYITNKLYSYFYFIHPIRILPIKSPPSPLFLSESLNILFIHQSWLKVDFLLLLDLDRRRRRRSRMRSWSRSRSRDWSRKMNYTFSVIINMLYY